MAEMETDKKVLSFHRLRHSNYTDGELKNKKI